MRLVILILFFVSGIAGAQQVRLSVQNTGAFARREVVSIPWDVLAGSFDKAVAPDIRIWKSPSGEPAALQWIDENGDGKWEELLFLAEVPAASKTQYTVGVRNDLDPPALPGSASGRFVPERYDDFAWENDRVAFRAYGPAGQQKALNGVSGATLSSGIDLWLKKVPYNIIDAWYAGHVKSPGFYHTDRGEGYDPYHVGSSRGTGGTGIRVGDRLGVSQNFTSWRILAKGPLRFVFELGYAPYGTSETAETKRVTLDYGSNFNRFDIRMSHKTDGFFTGISLHDGQGEIHMDDVRGLYGHWETIDGKSVGEGIVIDPGIVETAFPIPGDLPDEKQLIVEMRPSDRFRFYAGFAWEGSGQVSDAESWWDMLRRQAEIIRNPLLLQIEPQ